MPFELRTLDAGDHVRDAAFAVILTERRPVAADELALLTGVSDLPRILDELAEAGRIDRAPDGSVTGSAGLSLAKGPHRLTFGERGFRTWCAYDALGIPAALGATAEVETECGICGEPIEVSIVDGRPTRAGPELLWLAAGQGELRATFCTPTVLLCGPEHGEAWADRFNRAGELVALDQAAELGAAAWEGSAAAVRDRSDTEIEYVGGPRDSVHERRSGTPKVIQVTGGRYERSVRCADDGALRYLWREVATEPGR